MSLRTAFKHARDSGGERFLALLVSLTVLAQAYVAWVVMAGHSRPPMTRDAALFQHAGWYIANGAAPYRDVFDPKPPVTFELPAVLALVTEDMYLLHLLNVLLIAAAAIGAVVLAGLLTRHLTGDPIAGLVGGLSMLILPGYLLRPTLGYKPKYLVIGFGLAALFLAVRGNYFLSGIAAGASTGVWQIAIIYPLVVTGFAAHRGERRDVAAVVGGIGVAVVAMLVPVVLWGVVEPMLVQAVLIPFLDPEDFSLPLRLYWGVRHFRYGSILVLAGMYGVFRFVRDETETVRREWWFLALAGWFGFIALFVDFDIWGYTDLVPGLPFVAIGIGLLYTTLEEPRPRQLLVGVLAAVIVLNVFFQGGFGVVFHPVEIPAPGSELSATMDKSAGYPPAPETVPETRHLYWNKIVPENCHTRYSLHELNWITKTGRYPNCGEDIHEALRLLRGK